MPNEMNPEGRTKPAIRMRGVVGPGVAMVSAGVMALAASIPADLGVVVDMDAGIITIEIGKAVAALAAVVAGSVMGINGRLRASSTWSGKVVRR